MNDISVYPFPYFGDGVKNDFRTSFEVYVCFEEPMDKERLEDAQKFFTNIDFSQLAGLHLLFNQMMLNDGGEPMARLRFQDYATFEPFINGFAFCIGDDCYEDHIKNNIKIQQTSYSLIEKAVAHYTLTNQTVNPNLTKHVYFHYLVNKSLRVLHQHFPIKFCLQNHDTRVNHSPWHEWSCANHARPMVEYFSDYLEFSMADIKVLWKSFFVEKIWKGHLLEQFCCMINCCLQTKVLTREDKVFFYNYLIAHAGEAGEQDKYLFRVAQQLRLKHINEWEMFQQFPLTLQHAVIEDLAGMGKIKVKAAVGYSINHIRLQAKTFQKIQEEIVTGQFGIIITWYGYCKNGYKGRDSSYYGTNEKEMTQHVNAIEGGYFGIEYLFLEDFIASCVKHNTLESFVVVIKHPLIYGQTLSKIPLTLDLIKGERLGNIGINFQKENMVAGSFCLGIEWAGKLIVEKEFMIETS